MRQPCTLTTWLWYSFACQDHTRGSLGHICETLKQWLFTFLVDLTIRLSALAIWSRGYEWVFSSLIIGNNEKDSSFSSKSESVYCATSASALTSTSVCSVLVPCDHVRSLPSPPQIQAKSNVNTEGGNFLTQDLYCSWRLLKCIIQFPKDLRVSGASFLHIAGICPLNKARATSSSSPLIPTSPARAWKWGWSSYWQRFDSHLPNLYTQLLKDRKSRRWKYLKKGGVVIHVFATKMIYLEFC